MIKFIISTNVENKTVTAVEKHSDSLAVVTFSNGKRAYVSTKIEKGCFTPTADNKSLVPAFIGQDDVFLSSQFREANIDGNSWILSGVTGNTLPKL